MIAVVGAGGMLGQDVAAELNRRSFPHRTLCRSMCDVTSLDSCRQALLTEKFDVVINCAAYTNVNQAEHEEELALLVNGTGARNIATVCRETGARCIYVSTDYVFDGTKGEPYAPDDPPHPINAYGRTKLSGEQATAAMLPPEQFLVVRTSWLYGAHGGNFVKTMLMLARAGKDLKIINDQMGAPTYTADLAHGLADLAAAAPMEFACYQ